MATVFIQRRGEKVFISYSSFPTLSRITFPTMVYCMPKPHHVIYLPGLGDPRQKEQNTVIRTWKLFKISVQYHPLYWTDSRPFESKLLELVAEIDEMIKSGFTVSLVGVSAGASAALNTFAMRKDAINAVACVCGKINNLETISAQTYQRNPSFKESIALLPQSMNALDPLSRKKILSLRPLYDGVVPILDSHIQGATNKRIPTIGHAISIAYADTIGCYQIIRFFKLKNKLRF